METLSWAPPVARSDHLRAWRANASRAASAPVARSLAPGPDAGTSWNWLHNHAGGSARRGRHRTRMTQHDARPTCRCQSASVCTSTGLASFMMQIPTQIHDRSSPWLSYMRAVYRGDVGLPLPLDLSRFELFYPALLPVAPCFDGATGVSAASSLPLARQCSATYCSAWLPNPLPAADAVATFAANRSFIRIAASSVVESLHDFGQAVALQARAPERAPLSRYTWIEVTRYAEPAEGRNDYGCWYYPAVGSGVWVSTKRLLSWQRWRNAFSALRAWTGQPPGGSSGDARFAAEAAKRGWTAFEIVVSHGRASGWRELGQTVGVRELVKMDASCMTPSETYPPPHRSGGGGGGGEREETASGCTPVPMRAGWNASRECACVRARLINCEGTAVRDNPVRLRRVE